MISTQVIDFIYQTHNHRLRSFNQPWLSQASLQNYADVIHATGAPLPNCWGFIDGTVRPVSRPGKNQRVLYNGHKRVHAIKFQSIVAPNGLIANLFGPVEGRRRDSGMTAACWQSQVYFPTCNVTRSLLLDNLCVFMEIRLTPLTYISKDHLKESGSPLYRMSTTLQ